MALTTAATIVTWMTVDVTVTAFPMPLSASGPMLPRTKTTSAASGIATIAARVARIADSVRAMKPRWTVERAARPHQGEVRAPPFEEHPGDQHDRVPRQHGELDRQEGDPAVADEDGSLHLAQGGGQDRRHPRWAAAGRGAGSCREAVDAFAQLTDLIRREPAEVGDGPPLERDRPVGFQAEQVLAIDDERATRREASGGRRPVEFERRLEPIRVRRVRTPDAGQDDTHPCPGAQAALEVHGVADLEAERGRRTLGQRRADVAGQRAVPAAVDEGRMVPDRLERGQLDQDRGIVAGRIRRRERTPSERPGRSRRRWEAASVRVRS